MVKSKPWNWEGLGINYRDVPADEFLSITKRWGERNLNKTLDLDCDVGRHSIFCFS